MAKKMKISFNSPVILTFTLICVLSLVLGALTEGKSTLQLFSSYRSSFSNPMTYVRLLGQVFGHANLPHLMGNIMMILVIGPILEEKYGSLEMMGLITATAVATGLIYMFFFPEIVLLGASGVVFALILLASFSSISERNIPITFILVAILYLGSEVYNGIFIKDNIAHLGHIIGGIIGAIAGYSLRKK